MLGDMPPARPGGSSSACGQFRPRATLERSVTGNAAVSRARSAVRLGLKENWRQFSLLVLINAFVGGMVGIERTVVPLIGAKEFHIESTTLIISFIVSFGIVKALANLVSGPLADTWG